MAYGIAMSISVIGIMIGIATNHPIVYILNGACLGGTIIAFIRSSK